MARTPPKSKRQRRTLTETSGSTSAMEQAILLGMKQALATHRDVVKEKKIEQAQKEAFNPLSQEIRMILEGITDGLTIQSKDGSLIFANAAAARLVGFSDVDTFLRTPVSDVMKNFNVLSLDGEQLPLSVLPSRRALQGEYVHGEVVRFRVVATGGEKWAVVSASPIVDDQGKVLYVLNVFHDVTDKIVHERKEAFLAQAGSILSSSLDYETTLASISRLIVPELADWCSMTLAEGGSYRQLALSHADPAKIEWAKKLSERYPSDYKSAQGLGQVLHTGEPVLVPEVQEDMIVRAAHSPEHLALLREVGMKSVMIVPMKSREKILGAITFVSAESGQSYDQADLELAQELAERVSVAVDNAQLYRRAQEEIVERKRAEKEVRRLNQELERRVEERTRELEEARMRDRANLQRLKDMISNMPLAAVSADENMVILHANQRFCDLFGLQSPESIIGRNGVEILDIAKKSFAMPDVYATAFRQILMQQQPVEGSELQMANGTTLSCDYIPIFDNGVHRGSLLLYRDVTQERRVDRAKSEFMSLASHQLRTPLTVIRWALSRLRRDEELSARHDRLITAAKLATENMAESINAMLTISRIESEKVELQCVDIPLERLFRDLERECAGEYKTKQQRFIIECPKDLQIRTDEHLLREILLNLLRNAIKYTGQEGTVTVRAMRTEDSIDIAIEDTGLGIPLREQPKVFEKFFRAENAIEQDPNGTGLGLYLARIAARLLSATLTFVSQEGNGTTFTLRFPIESYDQKHSPR